MNYTINKNHNNRLAGSIKTVIGITRVNKAVARAITIYFLLVFSASQVHAEGDYQLKTLFEPDKYTLMAEAKGRVVIYDGLDSETVNRALDEEFDRIDNMMFVRIYHKVDDGEDYVEDDGCD